ncbi:MAG: phospho-sugar mutase, partial [Deltaproteobacteria bacterium]
IRRRDVDALAERFSGHLEFGTAGIRGLLGAGPARINCLVVRRVSAGLARYLKATIDRASERGVVIGFDGRHGSRAFALEATRVFLAAGLKVYLAPKTVPTPLTAFAVTHLGAAAGVMITASHNPPEYNGYKVYWENGAQIIPPHDRGISTEIEAVDLAQIPTLEPEDGRRTGLLLDLDESVERAYLDAILDLRLHPDASATPLRIAYTPLHGVGARLVEAAFSEAGFEGLQVEPSQRDPDGDFPTVRFPNPEEEGAMDRVLDLARRMGAELVLANDPDADRLAVAVPTEDGYQQLSGDQVGVLLADYLLTEGRAEGRRLVATTIVSSQLLGKMARAYGVDFVLTLTGFKWIGNAAIEHKQRYGSRFVIGYEEALGYSIGEVTRDKDGISAALLFAELCAVAKRRGETVRARLEQIYRRFGLFLTEQMSRVLPGAEGMATMQRIMDSFRSHPPSEIGGHRVLEVHDVAQGALGLPPSNVLIFLLEGDRRVVMRPSGTEPKLKSYYEVCEPIGEDEEFQAAVARGERALHELRDAHQAQIDALTADTERGRG